MTKPTGHSRQPSMGSDGALIRAFRNPTEKDNLGKIPSGCLCTWVVRKNRIWVLKFESNICPHKGKH